jgi:hypothetical protein
MRKRSSAEPGWAPATIPAGTPIATATRSAESVSTSVGSARSQSVVVTGRLRKYECPRSPRAMRP